MTDYDNTNRGALFKNDRKDTPKHPDYRGNINVEGKEFWVSAWITESKGGKKYMSLSVQPKDEGMGGTQSDTTKDDIPF